MKLEHAARQALECLEDVFGKGKVDVGAINALREALAEPEDMFIGFDAALKEAMENDPLYQMGYDAALAEQAEQEPVAWSTQDIYKDGVFVKRQIKASPDSPWVDYAAPVRTKDLTDEEIEAIMVEQGDLRTTAFARAVIAADREKNKND